VIYGAEDPQGKQRWGVQGDRSRSKTASQGGSKWAREGGSKSCAMEVRISRGVSGGESVRGQEEGTENVCQREVWEGGGGEQSSGKGSTNNGALSGEGWINYREGEE